MPIAETDRDPRLKGPLAGVRVIEMGQLLAGPFTSSRLADFGAEVIKVENHHNGGEMGRHVVPYSKGDDSLFFRPSVATSGALPST